MRTGCGNRVQNPAKRVDRDDYLIHLSAYIHLNPVEAGLVDRAGGWEFSSYREYLGGRRGTLLTPESGLSRFPSREAYRAYVESWSPMTRKS